MKITFLGTNGWYSSPTGDTPCILIDTNEYHLVLDAGNGIYKLDQYIKDEKPIYLFISHFHLDHVSGLHILNKFSFKQGIDVYLGTGRTKDFNTLVSIPFTVGYIPKPENIYNLKTEIRLHELSEEGESIPFKAYAIEQHHAYRDHGFRLEVDSKIVSYTGDCGYTEQAKKLALNADVLIAESGSKQIKQPDIWGHLDPTLAAALAKESNVKQLILTHFGADMFTTIESRNVALEEARKVFPNTFVAKDLAQFDL